MADEPGLDIVSATLDTQRPPAGAAGFRGPRATAVALLLVACAAAAIVGRPGVRPPSWYPPCPLHATVGWNCPGCGSARALHALVHGEWLAALHDNALLVGTIPLLFAWSLAALWRAMVRNAPPLDPPLGAATIVLVATLVFFVARNLPWWPCTLLAPLP